MKSNRKLLAACLTVLLTTMPSLDAQSPAPGAPPVRVDASAAIAKQDDGRFLQRHHDFLERGRSGPVGLLFLGDSITEAWTTAPAVWEKHYAAHAPANFGVGGNQTQNVIWQIEHGELDRLDPAVTVLLIGTNNSASHTGAEISQAVAKILRLVREKLPRTKILLLAIFPRGPRQNKDGTFDDGVNRMATIADANLRLRGLADGKRVWFLDVGDRFAGADGKIPKEIMPDQLHLTPAGYALWAEAMEPTLKKLSTP